MKAPDAGSLLKRMPGEKPLAIILAGHNGSGKSTLWRDRLSGLLKIPLVNADRLTLSILPEPPDSDLLKLPAWARSLRDDDVRWQQISQAAVRCLTGEVLKQRVSFAYETVFSHLRERADGSVESKADLIEEFRRAGYSVVLLFVGLANAELSILRVQNRHRLGGHSVPEEKLLSRFPRTQRAVRIAAPLADLTLMFDNSQNQRKAFTLVRAQARETVLYDLRDASLKHRALTAVAGPWLDQVAPMAGVA